LDKNQEDLFMQRQNLLLTTLLTTFAIGTVLSSCSKSRSVDSATVSAPVLSPSTKTDLKTPATDILVSGNFAKVDHSIQGMAAVVMKGSKYYLKLDNSFKSDEGPDLFVILHHQDVPKQYRQTDYVDLGKLKKIAGEQLYEIPAGVKISEFKSVAIWCRQFNSTFGFAPLK
jgi:hypothetical protein